MTRKQKKPNPVTGKKKLKTKKLKTKVKTMTQLHILALLGLCLAGGYYFARMGIASRLFQSPSGVLSVQLDVPGGGYASDGTKLRPAVGSNNHILTGDDDVSPLVKRYVDAVTATSLWTLYPDILVASERTALRAAISEQRLFLSALAVGSFASGFLLGLKSEPDPKALEARRNLKLALGDYLALGYKETDPKVRTIRRKLATLEQLNPELQQIKN
jgi:hypothetical protein